jgi:hypothetical protein
MEVGDTLLRELPQNIANCPPFPEVGDIMTTIEGRLRVVRCRDVRGWYRESPSFLTAEEHTHFARTL